MSGGKPTELTVIDPANATHHGVQPFSSNTLETFPWIASGDDLVAVNGLQDTETIPQVGTAVAFSPTPRSRSGRSVRLHMLSTPSRLVTSGSLSTPVSAVRSPPIQVAGSRRSPWPGRVLLRSRSYPCDWTVDGPAPAGLLVTRASKPPALEKSPETLSIWDPASDGLKPATGMPLRIYSWTVTAGTQCSGTSATRLRARPTTSPISPRGEPLCSQGCPTTGTWTQATSWPRTAPSPLSSPSPMPPRPLSEANGSLQHSHVVTPGSRRIPSEVFVYNLPHGQHRRVPPAAGHVPTFTPRWSADDAYLFLTLDLQHIEAVPLWSDAASVRVSAVPGDTADAPSESFLPLATEAFR